MTLFNMDGIVKYVSMYMSPSLSKMDIIGLAEKLTVESGRTINPINLVFLENFTSVDITRELTRYECTCDNCRLTVGDYDYMFFYPGIPIEYFRELLEYVFNRNVNVISIVAFVDNVREGVVDNPSFLTLRELVKLVNKDIKEVIVDKEFIVKEFSITKYSKHQIINAFLNYSMRVRIGTLSYYVCINVSTNPVTRVLIDFDNFRMFVMTEKGYENKVDEIVKLISEIAQVREWSKSSAVKLIIHYL